MTIQPFIKRMKMLRSGDPDLDRAMQAVQQASNSNIAQVGAIIDELNTLVDRVELLETGVNALEDDTEESLIDVVTYGADPTGVNSSNNAIRAAIADLPSHHARLYFPAGTYTITQNNYIAGIVGLKIYGDGPGITIINHMRPLGEYDDPTPPTPRAVFHLENCPSSSVSGMTLDGQWRATMSRPDHAVSDSGTRSGCLSQGCTDLQYHDLEVCGFESEALYADTGDRMRAYDNYCHDNAYPVINFGGGNDRDCSVTDNKVVDCGYDAVLITGKGYRVAGNQLLRTGYFGADPIYLAGEAWVCEDNIIRDTNMVDANSGLILASFEGALNTTLNMTGTIRNNVMIDCIFRADTRDGLYSGSAVHISCLGNVSGSGNIDIHGNVIVNCGMDNPAYDSTAFSVVGAVSASVWIHDNVVVKGGRNMTRGVQVFATVPSNNKIRVGPNMFDSGITTPHVFDVTPQQAPLMSGKPATAGLYPGYMTFDSSDHKPKWWDGTNWRDATGTIV